jgi:hypothetical protein
MDELAELEHLFPGAGWQFGYVDRSGLPPGRNLIAWRDGVLLAAAGVAEMAEKVRYEEDR